MIIDRFARIAAVLAVAGGTSNLLAQSETTDLKSDTGDTAAVLLPVLSQDTIAVNKPSGIIRNNGDQPEVIYSTTIIADDYQSVRLNFGQVILGGDKTNGTQSELRITSLLDGHEQILDAESIRQWGSTSAYFNGDAVRIELIAHPGSGDHVVDVVSVIAGSWNAEAESICGSGDDRTLSSDPRAARLLPIGCTGWVINDCERCFLTAGHCTGGSGISVAEFNVPLSDPDRSLNHPAPEDQYPVDPASIQSNGGQGTGNDWAYFGVFPNSNTGLRPHQAQGGFYEIATIVPDVGDEIRVTGYGSTSSPVSNTWYLAQKTHSGPFVQKSGDRLVYAMDTTGGNSGSAVVDELSGVAFGIHTHAGCNSIGGNQGTFLGHPALQAALANPQGVCFPQGIQFGPAGEILHIGAIGGPVNDATFQIMLDNPTGEPLDYRVSIASSEHTVLINGGTSAIEGTLAADSSISIPASLVDPSSQPAGIYTTVLEYRDLTNDRLETFNSVLEIGQTSIVLSTTQGIDSAGPIGGPFDGSREYTITSLRPQPVTVSISADQSWVNVGNGSSSQNVMLTGDGDAQAVTFSINNSVASGLPAGLYTANINVDNTQGDMGDVTIPVDLEVGRVRVAQFNMDTDPGWDREGLWAFGQPQGIGEDPSSGATGNNVMGTNLSGDYANNMGREFLTTDEIDLAGIVGAELVFQRWLAIERDIWDSAEIEYSVNGGAWQDLWVHTGSTFIENAWSEQRYDLSAADGQRVRVRWVMGETDGSVTYGGWNIDDVVFEGISTTTSVCLADVNADGELNGLDFGAWLGAFNANDPAADQNSDGNINGIDFGAWLSNFNAGCD